MCRPGGGGLLPFFIRGSVLTLASNATLTPFGVRAAEAVVICVVTRITRRESFQFIYQGGSRRRGCFFNQRAFAQFCASGWPPTPEQQITRDTRHHPLFATRLVPNVVANFNLFHIRCPQITIHSSRPCGSVPVLLCKFSSAQGGLVPVLSVIRVPREPNGLKFRAHR